MSEENNLDYQEYLENQNKIETIEASFIKLNIPNVVGLNIEIKNKLYTIKAVGAKLIHDDEDIESAYIDLDEKYIIVEDQENRFLHNIKNVCKKQKQ